MENSPKKKRQCPEDRYGKLLEKLKLNPVDFEKIERRDELEVALYYWCDWIWFSEKGRRIEKPSISNIKSACIYEYARELHHKIYEVGSTNAPSFFDGEPWWKITWFDEFPRVPWELLSRKSKDKLNEILKTEQKEELFQPDLVKLCKGGILEKFSEKLLDAEKIFDKANEGNGDFSDLNDPEIYLPIIKAEDFAEYALFFIDYRQSTSELVSEFKTWLEQRKKRHPKIKALEITKQGTGDFWKDRLHDLALLRLYRLLGSHRKVFEAIRFWKEKELKKAEEEKLKDYITEESTFSDCKRRVEDFCQALIGARFTSLEQLFASYKYHLKKS